MAAATRIALLETPDQSLYISAAQWREIRTGSLGRSEESREIRLQDLGRFPLDEKDLSLLNSVITFQGKAYSVPEFLKNSSIPVFVSADGDILVPRAGRAVCRFFCDMWREEAPEDENFRVLFGLSILLSFAGG